MGNEEATGADFTVEEQEDGPRPFQCLLDTGLKRTSTGSKVFAALKVCWPCHFFVSERTVARLALLWSCSRYCCLQCWSCHKQPTMHSVHH